MWKKWIHENRIYYADFEQKVKCWKNGQKLIFRFRQHLLTKCCLTIFPVQRGPKGVSWPNLSRFEEGRWSSRERESSDSRDLVRLILIEIEDTIQQGLSNLVIWAHWESFTFCHLMHPTHGASNNAMAELRITVLLSQAAHEVFHLS